MFIDVLKTPFSKVLKPSYNGPDFKEFVIQEIVPSGLGLKAALTGKMMPEQPFKYGGKQELKKEFYSGNVDPVIQVLGAREDDLRINGRIQLKNISSINSRLNLAVAMIEILDDIRKRGHMVRLTLGQWVRYGFVEHCEFEMFTLNNFRYDINFVIVSDKQPKNCPIAKTVFAPLNLANQKLADALSKQQGFTQPPIIPLSIGQMLDSITSDIASYVNMVTTLVDDIISIGEDITSSINRATGLVNYVKNQVLRSVLRLGRISYNLEFSGISVPNKYKAARYISSLQTSSNDILSVLAMIRLNLTATTITEPLARYLVKEGDELQTISNKFFGTPSNWRQIYLHNSLTRLTLEVGTTLEIPRI